MEISESRSINKLWNLPFSGKISNPYFGGKKGVDPNNTLVYSEKKSSLKSSDRGSKFNSKENNSSTKNVQPKNKGITLIEIDDSSSVHTPSTTDESDDSLNSEPFKVKRLKKRRSRRKEIKNKSISGPDSPTSTPTIKETTNGTINPKMPISQSGDDYLLQPMDISDESTEVNNKVEMTPTISNEATIQSTVINGTSSETQLQEDKQQSIDKQKCIRVGCCNYAVENAEWDFEYCSSNCAFEHCKTVFLNWVIARKLENQNSPTTKAPTQAVTTTID